MTATLFFTVTGVPAPQGSKRGFSVNGRVRMVESSKKVAPWRQDVSAAAIAAAERDGWAAPAGPLKLDIHFALPRLRSHYGTGRNADRLRDNAPTYVGVKPDLDKLVRSTCDALTAAGVIRDDAQIAVITTTKTYSGAGTGASITIARILEDQ